MKKLVLGILVAVFGGFVGQSLAANLPSPVTIILDRVVSSMCQQWDNLPYESQKQKYQGVIDFLDLARPKVDTAKIPVLEYIQTEFQKKLIEKEYPDYSIPHVDLEEVRQAWLKRHNQARAKKGLNPYKLSNALQHTAFSWAKYLASINDSTHKRKPDDGYYNYESIKNWFANFGVYFDESKGTAFSENIAYQYYSCKQQDCTQELIDAIRKGFDFFMSEASYNGAHYRAIMHPYFTEIGMGIGFVGKRYYIVTHYGYKVQ